MLEKVSIECVVSQEQAERVAEALHTLSELQVTIQGDGIVSSFRPFEQFFLGQDGKLSMIVKGVAA